MKTDVIDKQPRIDDATTRKNVCDICNKRGMSRYEMTAQCTNTVQDTDDNGDPITVECGAHNKFWAELCRECGQQFSLADDEEAEIKNEVGLRPTDKLTEQTARTKIEAMSDSKKERKCDLLCIKCQDLMHEKAYEEAETDEYIPQELM